MSDKTQESRSVLVILCVLTFMAGVLFLLVVTSAHGEDFDPLSVPIEPALSEPIAPEEFAKAVANEDLSPQAQAAVMLGYNIFFDPRVSVGNLTSCSSCHKYEQGSSDGRMVALGQVNPQTGRGLLGEVGLQRRSMPIVGCQLVEHMKSTLMFGDGRAPNPLAQCTMPMENPVEMGRQNARQVAARLGGIPGYQQLCQAALGHPQLTVRDMQEGLVAYMRKAWCPTKSPLARYIAGDEAAIEDEDARMGADLFVAHGCQECHPAPLFCDGLFHSTGWEVVTGNTDRGRGRITRNPGDNNKFKTAPLLLLAQRQKHCGHDGALNLDQVLALYNNGGYFKRGNGQEVRDTNIDPRIKKLGLTAEEVAQLKKCLTTTTTPYSWGTDPLLKAPAQLP